MVRLGIEILALLAYGPGIVLWHEAGHLVLARAGGLRATSFGIGLGRPLWHARLPGGFVLWMGRWVFLGGSATAVPVTPAGPRRAWFHAGGLVAQAVLAAVLFALPHVWWVDRMAQFNLLVFLTNAVPWRLGTATSDGMHLWRILVGRRAEAPGGADRESLERLARREAAIGSDLGEAWARLALAWADVRAGRTAVAGAFLAQDAPALTLSPWADALHQYVRAEWHRREGRPLAALHVARNARAVYHDDLGDSELGLLTLAEAQALVALDEGRMAQRVLARLAGTSGRVGRQAAAVHLAAALGGPIDEVALAALPLARRWTGPWLDPAEAAEVLGDAADALLAAGRVEDARPVLQAAQRLAARVLSAAAPEERPGLAARLGTGMRISTLG